MTTLAAFLQNGQTLPRMIPYPPQASDLTLEQQSELATSMAGSADFASQCADLSSKLNDKALASTGATELATSARDGNLPAAFVLGQALLEGGGSVAKDEVQGLQWLSKVAAAGYARAQTLIGWYYCFVGNQPAKGLPFLYAAAEQGHERAQMILGGYFDSGVPGVLEPDALESLRYLRLCTDSRYGDPFFKGASASILAEKYAEGRGVQRNLDEAIRWYRQAIEWGYVRCRVALIRLLKTKDAAQHAQEIRGHLDAAIRDGDAGASTFALDEEWTRDLQTLQLKGLSVDFWTRRMTYIGSEMRSDTRIFSTNSTTGSNINTVKDVWTELRFRQPDGHEVKVAPTKGGRTMVINPGEQVILVYAGPSQPDGNAKGFPYRVYKPGRSDVGDAQELGALLDQVLGKRRAPHALLIGTAFGLIVMFGASGFTSLLGLIGAAVAGWLWFRAHTRISDIRSAFDAHFDRVGAWVSRLS